MDAEAARELTRKWIVGIWDEQNFDLMNQMAAPDYSYSAPGEDDLGGADFREFVSSIGAAFPDLSNSIEEQVVEEDVVVTRGVTRGTHDGPFAGLEPTGRSVSVPWVIFTRFSDGMVVSDWELYDAAGLMAQLTDDS